MTAVDATQQMTAGDSSLSPGGAVMVVDDVEQAVPLARALAPVAAGHRDHPAHRRRPGRDRARRRRGAGDRHRCRHRHDPRRRPRPYVAPAPSSSSRPGSPPRLLESVLDTGLPFLAGSSTLTEMMRLAEQGLRR